MQIEVSQLPRGIVFLSQRRAPQARRALEALLPLPEASPKAKLLPRFPCLALGLKALLRGPPKQFQESF